MLRLVRQVPMQGGRAPRNTKVKPRSRLGCDNCKKLKTKCDETKPSCLKCSKRGIDCVYSLEMVFQNPKMGHRKPKRLSKSPVSNKRSSLGASESAPLEKSVEKCLLLPFNMPSFIPSSEIPILPLPENLLDHPYFREAFDFYRHFTAHFVVAAKPQLYPWNPLHTIVPELARDNKNLLDLLVSHALTHRSLVLTDENYNPHLIELLVTRGMYNLISTVGSARNEVTCISALMLCTQRIFSVADTDKYREIIEIAHTSYMAYIENDLDITRNDTGQYVLHEKKNCLAYFLRNWIGYFEIIGLMMYMAPNRANTFFREKLVYEQFELRNDSKIDLFLGFNIDFLLIFDRLIPILKEADKTNDHISSDVLAKALEWEHELRAQYQQFRSTPAKPTDPTESDDILNATNEVFYNTGLLQLYRRVYKIPRNSKIVQNMVTKIYKRFKHVIESASSAENCAILPLFVAACESIEKEHRNFFYERFKIQFLGGNFPTGDVLKILVETWNTGDPWIKSAERVAGKNGFFLI